MKSIRVLAVFAVVFSGPLVSCSKNKCQGKKKKDCVCLMYADPVCGCNGHTYSIPCEAGCDGVTDYTQGPCKQ